MIIRDRDLWMKIELGIKYTKIRMLKLHHRLWETVVYNMQLTRVRSRQPGRRRI